MGKLISFSLRALVLMLVLAWPVMLWWPTMVDAVGAGDMVDRRISFGDAMVITVVIRFIVGTSIID